MFETSFENILEKVKKVDPIAYGKSRNYLDGAVTYLSPYISRGVISTKMVLEIILNQGYSPYKIEKFIQELAWRDYWQILWKIHQEKINDDFKKPQPTANRHGIPNAILHHKTSIEAIDKGIDQLYETGYMHNHLRMYTASVACNIGKCHWKTPAQWMYYHLLDADWASNALSWQWVSGANSNKLYFANQENINKYCNTNQKNTFLDTSYEELPEMEIPTELEEVSILKLTTPLPQNEAPEINPEIPTLVYNFYNLDPLWKKDIFANRILLLEPSVFEKYPVSQKSIDFCIALAQENIPGIQVWVTEFETLQTIASKEIYFKEHPLNQYRGIEESRDWITNLEADFPSFFSFWKKAQKQLF